MRRQFCKSAVAMVLRLKYLVKMNDSLRMEEIILYIIIIIIGINEITEHTILILSSSSSSSSMVIFIIIVNNNNVNLKCLLQEKFMFMYNRESRMLIQNTYKYNDNNNGVVIDCCHHKFQPADTNRERTEFLIFQFH